MQIHASCGARDGYGVMLLGPPGCGKSDMLLRLIDRGFRLVADDRVDILDGWASAPSSLQGLIEVRGLGIVRLPHENGARVSLAVELTDHAIDRLPAPRQHDSLGVPVIHVDPRHGSAPQKVDLALECLLGRVVQVVGVFT